MEGGPKYKIQLRGQAALVQYSFDKHFINFGEVVSSSELVFTASDSVVTWNDKMLISLKSSYLFH